MKRTAVFLISCFAWLISFAGNGSENQAFERWNSDKYSMFIHFGLYSHLGGVWEGEPVRRGYSEQIQSFAGIFSDWYAATAYEFEPVNFCADRIAELATAAGMRSIVFTSKHHDGFCMYDTQTTDYNSMKMLPQGRDFVKELSDACARHGLNFGLYFSLIDWNFPHAYPISSHNADFVTKEHHEFSKAQVRELLTSYGPISELWFDMGSLEPWQSRELYDLVKELQPDCMVSGRLGNDVYDFAVMADNKLPQTALHAPWQSAASMFPETWSYRSWQERGEVRDKVAEKLRTLIKVVSHGGNYLLNVGPAADGSIVPFEKDVLLAMGRWLETNGDAIYGTGPSPFKVDSLWGDVTVKENRMNLLLTGKCPENNIIELPVRGLRLRSARGAEVKMKGGMCVVHVNDSMYSDPADVKVITLVFDRSLDSSSADETLSQLECMSVKNAVPEYSYSCFDYYSNYRSTVSYTWTVDLVKPVDELELVYTSEEVGRNIVLEIDGTEYPLTLAEGNSFELSSEMAVSDHRFGRIRGGVFDGPSSWNGLNMTALNVSEPVVEVSVTPFSNHLMSAVVEVSVPGLYMFDVTAGNGAEVIVNGKTHMKHLNPYRTVRRTEKLMLELDAGENVVCVRAYNRFEDTTWCGLEIAEERDIHHMKLTLHVSLKKGARKIRVYAVDRNSVHSDCELHNLRLLM